MVDRPVGKHPFAHLEQLAGDFHALGWWCYLGFWGRGLRSAAQWWIFVARKDLKNCASLLTKKAQLEMLQLNATLMQPMGSQESSLATPTDGAAMDNYFMTSLVTGEQDQTTTISPGQLNLKVCL